MYGIATLFFTFLPFIISYSFEESSIPLKSMQHLPGVQQIFMLFWFFKLVKLQWKKWKHWKRIEVNLDRIDSLQVENKNQNWSNQEVEEALSAQKEDQVLK